MRRGFLVGLIGRVFLTSLLVLMLGSLAWAQSATLQNGLGWLSDNQDIDGRWPGIEVADYHATSEALKTLTLLSPTIPALTAGRSWLETQNSSPTDFLARRIVADASAGVNASVRVNALVALRATSGGWGGYADHEANILDTARALQALKVASYPDLTIINPALAYLTINQNADGGWGFYNGDASNVYMTAVVSATLQQFPQMTTIATAVSNATSYLLAHQNADGGFGSSPSTVYETALAYAALAAVSTNEAALGSGVNYLTAAQSANGSWNDDPYSTALALKALYFSENRPSPPPPPPAGGKITGTVVDASTNQRLSGVAVVLKSNHLITTTTDSSGNFTLNDIPPGSETVSFALEGYKPSSSTASVVVDSTASLGNVGLVSSYSTGTIAGTITDSAGKPLAGVALAVTGVWSGSTTSGADGNYLFTYVIPGEVTITASKAGYQPVIAPGTVYARTTLTFSPRLSTIPSQGTTGTLVGRVVDSTWGLPIDSLDGEKGVTVTLSGGITAEPDINNRGNFAIQGLAPDTYQVTVGKDGYASWTYRVVIMPGVTTDLGTIRLTMSISEMTLTGVVTDASTGTPIRGAEVSVAGTLLAGRTDFSGNYAIADIEHPSEITVRTAATGYIGKSFVAGTQPFIQTMNIALVPRATTGQVTGTEVDVTVETEKASYTKSDTIGLTVTLWNSGGEDYATALHVKVVDPAGATAYDTAQDLNLAADATLVQNLNLVLPLSAPGGTYKAVAEVFNPDGMLLGTGTKSFSVATSRITVTPTLPAVLVTGANTVSFTLANTGNLAVSAGVLGVTLKDPDGEVISTSSQSFSLGLGESKTLTSTISIPPLKFGTYTLSYAQSDETIAGAATELPLPNTIVIVPLFDSNSHRIRETAGLTVTISNSGRFNLDPTGAGLPVTVSVPDAGYEETKTLAPAPVVGNTAGSSLLYRFALPETLTAGLHQTTLKIALPSGSAFIQTAPLAILESSLALTPVPTAYAAGGIISPVIANSGGVDTPVQYGLSLYDAKATMIAETTGTTMALAGTSLSLAQAIPAGAADGSYNLVVSFKDLKTGKEEIIPNPITIAGVKGSLQAQTDKQDYLTTEDITALSSITNSGTLLQDGNLHLQVTTTAGTQIEKTWTSRYDFQQGVRNGVDTFETQDKVTLLSYSDNFNDGILNFDRWTISGVLGHLPSEISEKMKMVTPKNLTYSNAGSYIYNNQKFIGDFDVFVDFDLLSPWQAPQNDTIDLMVTTQSPYYYMRVFLQRASWHSGPTIGTIGSNSGSNWIFVQNTSLKGKLRISRTGAIYSSYYWNGMEWVKLRSEEGPSGNLTVARVGVWGQMIAEQLEAHLDKFTVITHTYPASGALNLKYDSGRSEIWGDLKYIADIPEGTSIKFRTRASESESGLANSQWSDYITISGSAISSPQGRWIEIEATLATSDTRVTPILHDLTVTQGHKPGSILWQTDVPANLATGAVSELNSTIGTLGVTGKLFLQGTLTSSTGQTVASAEYPFYVEQGDMALLLATDKKLYRPVETVTVSGEVKNRSSVAAAGLVLRVQDPGAEEGTLYTETFDLPAHSSHPFTFTITAGAEGIHRLHGAVMQNNTTLAEITEQYETASPVVTATLTAPEAVGNQPFAITVSLNNAGRVDAANSVQLTDDHGAVIGTEEVTTPAGETRLIQYSRQIANDTLFTAVMSGDLNQTMTHQVAYVALPADKTVTGKIVVNKIAYDPNEPVVLTATINAVSMREDLSTLVTVTNSLGQALHSATTGIPTLIQGQSKIINNYWNTGVNPAGTYPVTLQILDNGTVVATATCDLVINSITKPAALLKGKVSLDKQSILTGEPITVSYSIANVGNIDLSGVAFTVKMVDTDDQAVYYTITDQTTLAMGATYSNSGRIDTQGYSAKDYLLVLLANIDGVEETLAGTYFRVNKDETPPELTVHSPAEGETYRTSVAVTARATDLISGIDRVEYRLDQQESWSALALSDTADFYSAFWETTFEDDGQHTLMVRAFDKAGNQTVSEPVAFEVLTDFTPPETRLEIGEPQFQSSSRPVYVTAATTFTLSATDDLSGVQETFYRFDQETSWRGYHGAFRLADLDFGPHTIYFRSIDNAGNQEDEKPAEVVLIGIEVETEVLNPPRVLVWTQDPARIGGKDRPAYSLADVENLMADAFAEDAYFQLVTEKDAFQAAFRSGIYNVVMILDQETPFDAGFLREMRDQVHAGTGLLVSSWGNSVHPIMQEIFGVDFRGSLAMDENARVLHLYDSPLSPEQTLVAEGRILRTILDDGTLAGVIPGESACAGIRTLTMNYPVEIRQGDRVTVSLSAPQGKQLVLIDEEQLTVENPAAIPVNNAGPPDGDIAITGITADGISFSLSAPYGYLGESYSLSVLVERPDGTALAAGPVQIAPTCAANLQPGAAVGLFTVGEAGEDRVRTSEDIPAAVLSEYGEGRAVFLAYDLVGSAASDVPGHSLLLRNAATWLRPPLTGPKAGRIVLLQTTIRAHGAEIELKAEETLDEGIVHRPLFGLTKTPLEYLFSLKADEEGGYRYFIESSDERAEYGKRTGVFLRLDEAFAPFDSYPFSFTIEGARQ